MTDAYLHGYSKKEQERLVAQARFLEWAVYHQVDFSQCKRIIEIGCGVGAQTEILLKRFPHLEIVSIDASDKQLATAKSRVKDKRVSFQKEDAKHLSFSEGTFDGAFICWLLEHVPSQADVVKEAHRVLKKSGKIYCTEVMNATLYLHPYSPATLKYWFNFNDHQWSIGGDPFVGAKLGNFLTQAGFNSVRTWPLTFHFDNRSPTQRTEMFQYWTDLLLSGTESLVASGRVTSEEVKEMSEELIRLKTATDSVFYYSSIQAIATKD